MPVSLTQSEAKYQPVRTQGNPVGLRHRKPTLTIELAFLLFALVVVAAYAVQTAIGFGSTLICVTFGAQLIGLQEAIHLVVPISFLQTGYIVIRHRDGIEWRLLLSRVLPLMGVGMGFAFLLLARVGPARDLPDLVQCRA